MEPTAHPADVSDGAIGPGHTVPRTTWLLLGGLVSAGLASACCLGPAVLGLVGLGTVGAATVFEPYRPYLIGLTLALLAAAFSMAYRRQPETSPCCLAQEDGSARRPSRRLEMALWGVAGLAVLLIGYPTVAGLLVPAGVAGTTPSTVPSRSVALSITGMTCDSCAVHVRKVLLEDRSVVDAQVSHAEGIAHVQIRTDTVGAGHLVELIQGKTPYQAAVVSKAQGR